MIINFLSLSFSILGWSLFTSYPSRLVNSRFIPITSRATKERGKRQRNGYWKRWKKRNRYGSVYKGKEIITVIMSSVPITRCQWPSLVSSASDSLQHTRYIGIGQRRLMVELSFPLSIFWLSSTVPASLRGDETGEGTHDHNRRIGSSMTISTLRASLISGSMPSATTGSGWKWTCDDWDRSCRSLNTRLTYVSPRSQSLTLSTHLRTPSIRRRRT